MEVDRLAPQDEGLHPLAVILGVVGILALIVIVAASSYQREKLQHMARKMLRKKRLSVSDDKQRTCWLVVAGTRIVWGIKALICCVLMWSPL